jgi:tyrosine-protein kinase Etk/Wzc
MENSDFLQIEQRSKQTLDPVRFDSKIMLSLLLKNWYWFFICTVTGLFCAHFYIGHTMHVYRTSATILINETETRQLAGSKEILQGLGLPGGMQNLQNQKMILKSKELIEKTLKELPFEVEYYFKTFRNKLPIYPEVPLKLVSDNEIPLPKDIEFSISFLGNNMYNLESGSKFFPLKLTSSFGGKVEIPKGNFIIECNDEEWIKINKNRKLYFIIHKRSSLVNYYSSQIAVELVSRDGSILQISVLGTNTVKDADFLNKHLDGFQSISLDKKNAEANRRIQFIDDQLVGISDSLSMTENRLQKFRSANKVMDLSVQGQSIIGQVTQLENERARLNLEANYFDYLAGYLNQESTTEIPIVPVTMGITDPGITSLVNELTALQSQLSSRGAGVMNPLQKNLEQKVRAAKDALRETLNGLRRANNLARSENQDQINKANDMASALPVTERRLLGIERKFKLNDELYTFLLETRAEQKMQKASNKADSEIVDKADQSYSTLVSPDAIKVNFLGLFAGFGIPFSIIFLNFLFNKKLKDEDIDKITDIPLIGKIPHNSEKNNIVVFEYPNSTISEAFRSLRVRMQFFTKEAKAPVILVTSAMPGDGKTFTAINLASAYSLLGKKTILVGFDLRNPKIFEDFNLDNDKGVSTWLIGKDKLDDIIKETSFENLSIITAGPIPPNPSELTSLGKTNDLLNLLKERYEYILIDSSPIGIVSDSYYLASLADSCLFIVRPNMTLKDMFEKAINEIKISDMKGVSLVINDIQPNSKHYGYGERYGYGKEKKNLRIHTG